MSDLLARHRAVIPNWVGVYYDRPIEIVSGKGCRVTAKGLGNGFAIGGVVARGGLLDGIRGNGISTFGGNPIATAAGNATLDYVLSHDLQQNAAHTGTIIIDGLRAVSEEATRP